MSSQPRPEIKIKHHEKESSDSLVSIPKLLPESIISLRMASEKVKRIDRGIVAWAFDPSRSKPAKHAEDKERPVFECYDRLEALDWKSGGTAEK